MEGWCLVLAGSPRWFSSLVLLVFVFVSVGERGVGDGLARSPRSCIVVGARWGGEVVDAVVVVVLVMGVVETRRRQKMARE
jgi:hypothetical protein